MVLNFRFAIASDLHIALPDTIWDHPKRFHLVEVSIAALEQVFEHLERLDIDFLLLPGDLTQHGERDNHAWLSDRLKNLPYPAYVVPGNHDVPLAVGEGSLIGLSEFPEYYPHCGYQDRSCLYYTCELRSGVRLIGLNSNGFDEQGNQIGYVDEKQLDWLRDVLAKSTDELVLVMIHHNIIEHLPGQSTNPLGRRYMLSNAPQLLEVLERGGVQLVFTGHLHVQDIAKWRGVYDITTGSLVSYPHPYRILNFSRDDQGQQRLEIESHRIVSVPGFPDLPSISREWMGDRSFPFMMRLLMGPPLGLSQLEAEELAPSLRYFWADIAGGDARFDFPEFPPLVRQYFEGFGASEAIDNRTILRLSQM
ncbi:metallophosphoesterase family protein [Arthrospira platensis]|jgi:predicted phosphodiesterase|uniref:Calcineurin-like phosphoesterase domain-containing protein n=1 Tax=Limnospira platensis NIES-46 TaxID=1236695 RepID=A0A5M3T2Y1_LIMPL|nr:metallophosphoesterase [Arthrospira platensis]AMW30325.1 metallophosphoesterase [Arthrospira platensis YZ]KDR58823.1 metallophosphoesterase [Arthrospira platensis str. Paraca]MBD2669313.1 metallophosphoesterase [Arthrospira platensis FACHB-439]MBD2711210.1 metallophosphoesterase [Arthrospira platensis FACHB-835]MDF2207745.1 metallophosphoesterase [Arthrospira platensis NCB002]MDT9183532.1 metallophosphoesterase [Limnospira sp. PMC 289.06]MDT9310974.1 metallophosphoesterase [Limnospira sp.